MLILIGKFLVFINVQVLRKEKENYVFSFQRGKTLDVLFVCFIFASKLCASVSYFLLMVDCARWIDVCQSNGNLLASGGEDCGVHIFDKRESRVVQIFPKSHTSEFFHFFEERIPHVYITVYRLDKLRAMEPKRQYACNCFMGPDSQSIGLKDWKSPLFRRLCGWK